MATGRRSYSGLMRLPGWGLYDADGRLIGSVRARTAVEARDLFRRGTRSDPSLLNGDRVRRLP